MGEWLSGAGGETDPKLREEARQRQAPGVKGGEGLLASARLRVPGVGFLWPLLLSWFQLYFGSREDVTDLVLSTVGGDECSK